MYDLYDVIQELKSEIEDYMYKLRLGYPRFFVLENTQLMNVILNFKNDLKNASFITYLFPFIKGLLMKSKSNNENNLTEDDIKLSKFNT